MNRSTWVVIIVIGVLAGTVYLLVQGYFGDLLESLRNPWAPHYETASWQPYGTRLARDLMEESVADFEMLEGNWDTTTLEESGNGDMLVFMHQHHGFWPESHQRAILDFVERGGVLFMAINKEYPGNAIWPSVFEKDQVQYQQPPHAALYLDDRQAVIDSLRLITGYTGPSPTFTLAFPTLQLHDSLNVNMSLHAEKAADSSRFVKAGHLENGRPIYVRPIGGFQLENDQSSFSSGGMNVEHFNAFEMRIGKGSILYHTAPLTFTNYYLRKASGFDYLDVIVSGYQPQRILWDEGSKNPNFFREQTPSSNIKTDSPLGYILQQPALRWAWYTLLAGLLLFLLLAARRRERPVPLLPFRARQTRNFVSTLAEMSRSREDAQTAGRQRMDLFQKDIRERLGLEIEELDEATQKRLSIEAQVPAEDVAKIAKAYEDLMEGDREQGKNLLRFHQAVDAFYQKSQLWIPLKTKGRPSTPSPIASPGGAKP